MVGLCVGRKSENLRGTLGASNVQHTVPFVPFLLEDGMKRILLLHGKIALVDNEDYNKIKEYHWCVAKPKNHKIFYAVCRIDYDRKQH